MFFALLEICLFSTALGQVHNFGGCPEIKPMENFDFSKFVGVLYQQEHYREAGGRAMKCISLNITKVGDGTRHVLIFNAINIANGIQVSRPGYIVKADSTGSGAIHVFYPSMKRIMSYRVVDTDYESYFVVYSCHKGFLKNHYDYVFLYTRERKPPESVIAKYVAITEKYNFKRSFMQKVEQDDCQLTFP